MKKVFVIIAAFTAFTSFAQSVTLPQPSPTQTIKQNFGLGSIELSYSRPSIKNRVAFKESSELAPLDKVWRTGANKATILTFSEDLSINSVTVKAGKYGLLTIPGKKSFTIIVTKDTNVSQPNDYVEANDVVRYTAPIEKLGDKAELFTMQFENITYESCQLHLMWGNVGVALPINTLIKEKLKANVQKSLDGDKPAYTSIATYYYEIEKDYTHALEAITKAINSGKPSFPQYLLKAKIEKELGDKVSARASAEKCVELAKIAKNDDYVRSAKAFIGKL